MTPDHAFYRDLAYIFGAALLGGSVARALRQPMILGYVLGGILIGPFTPGPKVANIHEFESLAEIGVILLMYTVGLEFSFDDLRGVKWVAIIGAPLGIFLSVLFGLGVSWLLNWNWQEGVALGAIISVASTMVLSRLLTDRGLLRSNPGQIMMGITLVEDLAVVMMTILLPSVGSVGGGRLIRLGLGLGKSLLILVPVIFVASKLVPRLTKRVLGTRNAELLVIAALALSFITAAITEGVGLSLALGAFLAGLLVCESSDAHQTMNQMLPLRDAFVALFFVTMGALVNPRILFSRPSLLLVIIAITVVGKFVIWATIVLLFRYPLRTAMMVGIGLAQIGEFSYVLVQVARDAKLVGEDMYNATLAASVITILLNGLFVRFFYRSPALAAS